MVSVKEKVAIADPDNIHHRRQERDRKADPIDLHTGRHFDWQPGELSDYPQIGIRRRQNIRLLACIEYRLKLGLLCRRHRNRNCGDRGQIVAINTSNSGLRILDIDDRLYGPDPRRINKHRRSSSITSGRAAATARN